MTIRRIGALWQVIGCTAVVAVGWGCQEKPGAAGRHGDAAAPPVAVTVEAMGTRGPPPPLPTTPTPATQPTQPTQAPPADPNTVAVRDSLGDVRDPDAGAQRALDAVRYESAEFEAHIERVPPGREGWGVSMAARPYASIEFPSPKPAGIKSQDTVRLWWYAARDAQGEVIDAPAVLVVHSMLPTMQIGKAIAASLANAGFHAFMMEMPGYGGRTGEIADPGVTALVHGTQAVADARRSRDVVLAMPRVKGRRVGIQGTSLGGFLAGNAAALDGAFDPVLLLLSGGDAAGVLRDGSRDAAVMRRNLALYGYEGDRLTAVLAAVEPLLLAHRLDAEKTWLWTAEDDRVVPRRNSDAFARAASLEGPHRVLMGGNHYTSMLALPRVVEQYVEILRERE